MIYDESKMTDEDKTFKMLKAKKVTARIVPQDTGYYVGVISKEPPKVRTIQHSDFGDMFADTIAGAHDDEGYKSMLIYEWANLVLTKKYGRTRLKAPEQVNFDFYIDGEDVFRVNCTTGDTLWL
jgi:hypothetical protein